MDPCRAPIIVPAPGKHTATMFFFHGRGDNGDNWSKLLKYKSPFSHIKYVCPHAATRPNTVAGGAHLPAWFDVTGFNMKEFDDQGIRDAVKEVHKMVGDEIKSGIPPERIILSGFSQGGALVLASALSYPKKLAGIIGLSTYLPMFYSQIKELPDTNLSIPIFQTHGDSDPLLLEKVCGEPTAGMLHKYCSNHVYKVYKGLGHDANEEVLDDMFNYIKEWLPK